jgi:hypothetical protein
MAFEMPLFSGAESLGIGAGLSAMSAGISAHHAPMDFSYHGWTDAGHSDPYSSGHSDFSGHSSATSNASNHTNAQHSSEADCYRPIKGPYPIPKPPPYPRPGPDPTPGKPINNPFIPRHDPMNVPGGSAQMAGNSKGFGAVAEVHTPIKIGGHPVIVGTDITAGGAYNHPRVLGGGMQVAIPLQ